MAIEPIFIFSISRSGSTLVQRIIAGHEGVATVSEPWLLLPFLYTLRRQGIIAEYVQPLSVAAIEDFCEELPGGRDEYLAELRDLVLRLYEKAAEPGSRYFLDKTPPYHLIAGEIIKLFPEGKFIFLWRNPLSVISSIMETWQGGDWYPTMFRGDLFSGLPHLIDAYQAASARSYSVRFEDLVKGDEAHWARLMNYLGIDFDPETLRSFSTVELKGRMGDPTGTKSYTALNRDTNVKWKGTFGNPLRKAYCRRYLRFLGSERLAVMGYSADQLLTELDAQPGGTASLLPDIRHLIGDVAKEPVRVRIRRQGLGGPNVIRELLKS
jgi:hypothetical protein